jgi:hypothetical protein
MSDDNVVKLSVVDKETRNRSEIDELISRLKSVIERAKEKEVVGFALAIVSQDEAVATSYYAKTGFGTHLDSAVMGLFYRLARTRAPLESDEA